MRRIDYSVILSEAKIAFCHCEPLAQMNLTKNPKGEINNMDREELLRIIKEAKLKNITYLNLSNKYIKKLPPEISQLKNLKKLYLYNNQLSHLPPEIGQLKNLKTLDIGYNRLSQLPPEICQLRNLHKLSLGKNQLSKLPFQICLLENLQELYINSNQISYLPPEIVQLKNLKILYLEANPITSVIPPEITKDNDAQKIISYYLKTLDKDKTKPLNEIKLILIGQGEAGKTSLVRRLIDDKFDMHERMTRGILIKDWLLNVNGDDIKVNIWDFGGQEIMHGTHRFFLTERCIYLLVLEPRKDDNEYKIDYWLNLTEKSRGNFPVIIVCNKRDISKIELDNYTYKNIKEIAEEVSCKERIGIDDLIEKIKEQIKDLKHVKTPFPNSWFKVKEELGKRKEKKLKI